MAKKLHQTGQFLDFTKLLGYNRYIYMILTDRGFGKTFGTKKLLINDFLKKGKKFVYLRRYKPEMKFISTFFDDIEQEFPEHEFKVKGWNLYCDGKLMGVGMLLSRYQDYKGGAFPDYDNIFFDEFLREKVKSVGYMPNDVEAFLSICDSVFRKREGVKAILNANTVNEVNPYFIDFKINRLNNSEYAFSKNPKLKDKILVYIREMEAEALEKASEESGFRGVLSAVDKYANHAIGNNFNDDNASFVKKKSKQAKFYFALKVSPYKTFGVWVDMDMKEMYVTWSYEKTTTKIFAFDKNSHSEDTIFVRNYKDEYLMTRLVNAFKMKVLFFENLEIKMALYDLFSSMRIF